MWPIIILAGFLAWTVITLCAGYNRGKAKSSVDAYALGRREALENKRDLIRTAYNLGSMRGKGLDQGTVQQQPEGRVR